MSTPKPARPRQPPKAPGASAPSVAAASPHVLYLHLHDPAGRGRLLGAEPYGRALELLRGITPAVEPLPPDAALLDVRGSLRYFDLDAAGIAQLVRVRILANLALDCTVGVAANPLLARMAAHGGAPGAVRVLDGDREVAEFLAPCPLLALPGVGPATARSLAGYGLHTVGALAATPLATVQRILGASAGRRLHERAHGLDPTPVTPGTPSRSLAADRDFDRDELDPELHRRALRGLVEDLGARLRTQRQAAGALTLTVRYADRSTTVRSRTLAEASAHGAVLTACAYRLYDALGLQRARVRAVTLRAEGVRPAEYTTHQLTFDPGDHRARRVEEATDRARARYGEDALRPAVLLTA